MLPKGTNLQIFWKNGTRHLHAIQKVDTVFNLEDLKFWSFSGVLVLASLHREFDIGLDNF
jgi:hypothetical protein